jgi:predicted ferric reductase
LLLDAAPGTGLETATWEFIRASGLVAVALLSASVFLGIAISVRALDPITKRAYVYEGHQTLSLLAAAMTGLHMALLLVHKHVEFTPREVLLPAASDWRPLPVALGIGAFYITAVLIASSYARPLIGQKTWRALHYSSFVSWVLAMGHGIAAGSDTGVPAVQWFYLAAAGAVGLLFAFRVLAPGNRPKARPTAPPGPSPVPAGAEVFAPRGPAAK